jgi:hypothetical protein
LFTPITLVAGLVGLPRWGAIAAIILMAVVVYLFLFTRQFCCEV